MSGPESPDDSADDTPAGDGSATDQSSRDGSPTDPPSSDGSPTDPPSSDASSGHTPSSDAPREPEPLPSDPLEHEPFEDDPPGDDHAGGADGRLATGGDPVGLGAFHVDDGVVIYDRENHRAWLQSSAARDVAAMA